MNDFTVQQGWQCPICKRVYSPLTFMCYFCGGEAVTSTGTGTFSDSDWKKKQDTGTRYPQGDNFITSISNGRDTFIAQDIRTCDNCNNKNTEHCENENKSTYGFCGNWGSCEEKENKE